MLGTQQCLLLASWTCGITVAGLALESRSSWCWVQAKVLCGCVSASFVWPARQTVVEAGLLSPYRHPFYLTVSVSSTVKVHLISMITPHQRHFAFCPFIDLPVFFPRLLCVQSINCSPSKPLNQPVKPFAAAHDSVMLHTYLLVVLGFELKTLWLLSKWSMTWATPLPYR
jgi:hypothetical protein